MPKVDSWGNKVWVPVDEPYRVSRTFQSSAPYDHGWRYARPNTYATYEEAYADFIGKQGRGFIKATIDIAINPETWLQNGKWKTLQSRKNGQYPAKLDNV